MYNLIKQNREIIFLLVRREFLQRSRGSILGVGWNIITPILTVLVFGLVFGQIFQQKWGNSNVEGGINFAVPLFVGLVCFNFFSEVVTRSSSLISAHSNFIKKVPIQVEILSVIITISSLVFMLFGTAALVVFLPFTDWGFHRTFVWVPVIMIPFVLLTLGLSWTICALGVFLKDISQVLPPIMTAAFFLSPIIYPIDSLSGTLKSVVYMNPITYVVEELRNVLVFGNNPDMSHLTIFYLVSIAIALIGKLIISKLKEEFADEL